MLLYSDALRCRVMMHHAICMQSHSVNQVQFRHFTPPFLVSPSCLDSSHPALFLSSIPVTLMFPPLREICGAFWLGWYTQVQWTSLNSWYTEYLKFSGCVCVKEAPHIVQLYLQREVHRLIHDALDQSNMRKLHSTVLGTFWFFAKEKRVMLKSIATKPWW